MPSGPNRNEECPLDAQGTRPIGLVVGPWIQVPTASSGGEVLDHDLVTVGGVFALQHLEAKGLEPFNKLVVSGDLEECGARGDGANVLYGGFQKEFPVALATSIG